jgi:hypothetical protein
MVWRDVSDAEEEVDSQTRMQEMQDWTKRPAEAGVGAEAEKQQEEEELLRREDPSAMKGFWGW